MIPAFLRYFFTRSLTVRTSMELPFLARKTVSSGGKSALSLQVPGQGGDCLILQGDRPILFPLPLPDGEGPVLQIQLTPLKAHELPHPDAGLEKQLQDGKIPGVVAGFIEQGLIFILLQHRRILLLFEWTFDRIRRTAINDLVFLQKPEKLAKGGEFAETRNAGCLERGQVVYKIDNACAVKTAWNIPINSSLLHKREILFHIVCVCPDCPRTVIAPIKRLFKNCQCFCRCHIETDLYILYSPVHFPQTPKTTTISYSYNHYLFHYTEADSPFAIGTPAGRLFL